MGKNKSKNKQKKPKTSEKLNYTTPNIKNTFNKKKYYFSLICIISVLVGGGLYSGYSLMGGYVEEITKPFPLWKQYQVGFTTVNLPGDNVAHYEYLYGLGNVRGDLVLTSTVFSVNNKINVNLILRPEFKETLAEKAQFIAEGSPVESSTIVMDDSFIFQKLMDTLPQTFFIVFIGAENIENIDKNNDRFAIINVTRNFDRLQFEGSGDIIYEFDDTREILFLDPSQLSEFMEVRKDFTSDLIEFTYSIVPQPEFPKATPDSATFTFKSKEHYANLIDGKTVQNIKIESEDVISEIEQKNITYATIGFTVMGSTIPFLVMVMSKIIHNKSKN